MSISCLLPVMFRKALWLIIATLSSGAYTAVARGVNNMTGIAVVEGYDLDADKSSKLANLSTRGFVQTGDNVMIGGLILKGGTGATMVVVRGIGVFWHNEPPARSNARAGRCQWRDHRFERRIRPIALEFRARRVYSDFSRHLVGVVEVYVFQ